MKQFIRTTTRLGPRLFLIVGLLAGALGVSGAQTAQAASIGCTASDLITAIDDANGNPDTTTIDLATNCTYTLTVPVPDADGYHGLEITTPVTINGNGATITRDNSAPIFRILLVTGSGSLTAGNLTVSNGNMNSPWPSQPKGGGILNFGTVTLNDSTVSGNSALSDNSAPESNDLGFGGGIYNANVLTVNNSTFSGNSTGDGGGGIYNQGTLNVTGSTFSSNFADNQGGGIFNYNTGTATVTNSQVSSNTCRLSLGGGISNNAGTLNVVDSTFSGNVCPRGGALWNGGTATVTGSTFLSNRASQYGGGGIGNQGPLTVVNSTFVGNSAYLEGGGIISSGPLNVVNSTFSGNSASSGGGIAEFIDTASLKNTLVANNSGGNCVVSFGTLTAGADNMADDATCGGATPKSSAQINLQALANNGGPTQTMRLGEGSHAIHAGNNTAATNAGLTTDQRGTGFPRIRGGTVDVGAFEACAAGTYDTGSGCVPADPGHYVAVAGATSQTPCALGFYQPNAGSTSCIAADPGHYVDSSASSAQTACAPGSYQPNSAAIACNLADPGYYVASPGATAQTACPTGYTSNAGATSCTPLDAIPPTAAPTQSPAANGAGWNNTDVTVNWNWTDNAGGSGIDSANCTILSPSSGEGTLTLNANCKDNAGNTGSASYTVKVDTTAPSITITSPTATSYLLNQVVAANFSCSDGGSGVASCVGTVASGANINTGSGGTKTFTVNATDNVGNTSTVSVNYNVSYNFTGFFQPVDNLPTLNVVKAGSAIPIKFSLGGNFSLNIFATNYPVSQRVACYSSDSLDTIEETVTAGGSSLSYDATTNQYTYIWKTDKAWANTCRQLHVKLSDGSDHIADFKFTK